MENIDNKIKEWLNIDSSYDYGAGYYVDSYGDEDDYDFDFVSGSGSDYGFGYGAGTAEGYGCQNGAGEGDGYGDGLKSINKNKIYNIDYVSTIIKSIHNNVAKGFIFKQDLTLEKCYIAKGQNKFAHGKTIKEALRDLEEKIMKNIDTEEVISRFKEEFTDYTKKYKASDFYQWHNYLTGSCEMGRKVFAKEHNINIGKDKMTVQEFIELTKNSYGGEIIKELEEAIK